MSKPTREPLFHISKRGALPWYLAWGIRGVAVIYVGEDLDVLLELADRILVLCGGKVSGIVPGRGAKKRDVGLMMTKLGGEQAHE